MKKPYLIGILGLMLGVVIAGITVVHANPSLFSQVSTSTATTTPTYISGGKGTTTLVYDAQTNGDNFALNSAYLLVQFTASSSALSTLNINIQYSDDGKDYFWETVTRTASSTSNFGLGVQQTLSLNVSATSTPNMENCINAAACANGATSSRAFMIEVPTRYVRAIFTAPASAQPSAFWAQWIGKKENR